MITADTITDEQIRELRDGQGHRRFTAYEQTWGIWQLCMDAMMRPDYQRGDARTRIWERGRARELCAEIVQAAQVGLAEVWLRGRAECAALLNARSAK